MVKNLKKDPKKRFNLHKIGRNKDAEAKLLEFQAARAAKEAK
jgi:hypothetical protein